MPKKTKKKRVSKKEQRARLRVRIAIAAAAMLPALLFAARVFLKSAVPDAREFTIRPGAGVSAVACDLGQGPMFIALVNLRGCRVMAGTYDLPGGASVWRIARMLANGEITTISVTIPEGQTSRQIARLLGAPDDAADYADGSMFPSTYIVSKGAGPHAVMDMMKKKMDQVRGDWEKSGANPPAPLKDWHDVMTLASIVQKETGKTAEMPLIAGVYLNRLRRGMRLQADPTVVYALTGGLGDMEGKRLWSNNLKIDSPYNTYRNSGLPPAPIANVGMDAIEAVLRPEESDYLFFVADGTGGHKFSKTLAEHNMHRANWRKIRN
ncbi:MAG: endolytic transglycosylase MltG [Rickettsiales bacterium]|jgi:UPF0755 protein|nr:endolytic transglycosylase MltG [Rickettsiales bacterium]